jgi:phytoene dehydrogenase-like protein
MPYMGIFRKWSKLTTREFAGMCKNPLLRKAILSMFLPDSAIIFIIFTLAWMHQKQAGYPVGGSLNFARLIEQKYIELGGEIRYNSKVKKIVVENDKTRGVTLDNGESFNADFVISAADGHYTIYNMLEGKYVDEKIAGYYKNMKMFPSLVYVSLGISRTFENESQNLVFPLKNPIFIDASISHKDIWIRIFNFDPTLAKKGKTCLTAMFETNNYEYWTDLRKNDRDKYNREKERIAKEVIDALEKRFGNIKEHVEVFDVATPATFIRYTNNWKGSFEGWLPTADMFTSRMKKELPGLKNFYMIGQWVEPGGGLPPALTSGRNAAQVLCRRDKKKFKVSNSRG